MFDMPCLAFLNGKFGDMGRKQYDAAGILFPNHDTTSVCIMHRLLHALQRSHGADSSLSQRLPAKSVGTV